MSSRGREAFGRGGLLGRSICVIQRFAIYVEVSPRKFLGVKAHLGMIDVLFFVILKHVFYAEGSPKRFPGVKDRLGMTEVLFY